MDAFAAIRRPIYTEKGHAYIEASNTYVFHVADEATKTEIKDAIASLWGVTVKSVRTLSVTGKPKRYRWRFAGRTRSWKKAYVRLAQGQAIDALK